MKRNLFSLILVVLAIINLNTSSLQAQKSAISDGLSLKIGTGVTTFYGEMSPTGISILKNTQVGFAGAAVKMINPFIGIQLQFFNGYIGSLRTDLSQYFDGNVNEYSLSFRLEPLYLFNSRYAGKLNPYLRGGLATTSFRAVRRDVSTNTVYLPTYGYATDGITKIPSEKALSIPLAFGLRYQISDKLSIEAEQSISITNTDVLDAVVGTAASNDLFGFTQIGIRYTLKPTQSARSSNAGSSTRLSRSEKRKLKEQGYAASNLRDAEINEISIPSTSFNLRTANTANIFIEAKMPENPESGKVFEVSLRINKGDYQGVAILRQTFPDGFTALKSDIGYSRFSFINQQVKIVWENLPADSIITYSYHVRANELVYGSHTINGSFEFSGEAGPKMINFANYIFVKNQVESNIDAKLLKLLGDDVKYEESITATKNKENIDNFDIKLEDLLRKYGTDSPSRTRVSGSNVQFKKNVSASGIEFRIQCGAFRSSTEGKQIVSKFKLTETETVTEDYHQGWFKYTIGSFQTYNEAAAYRDRFIQRSKIFTAFIVAYKNGKRLSNLNQAFK